MDYYRISSDMPIAQLLSRLAEQYKTGCLQLSEGQITWSILLNQGRLFYATNSAQPFERFDRHLRKLRPQIPTLVSAIRDQMQTLFEPFDDDLCKDYQAIHWLVAQNYLAVAHAALLVEKLSEEVMESLLAVQTGDAVLLPFDPVSCPPVFCNLDLPWLLEFCQSKLEQQDRHSVASAPLPQTRSAHSTVIHAASTQLMQPALDTVELDIVERRFVTTLSPQRSSGQRPFSILCIERSQTMQNLRDLLLDDEFFSVTVVQDLLGSLIQIASSKPDLILLDASQPKDAYGLCTLLRGYPEFRKLPIIAVTSHSGLIDRFQARLAGASDYLVKPFTRPQLVKMLFKHLG